MHCFQRFLLVVLVVQQCFPLAEAQSTTTSKCSNVTSDSNSCSTAMKDYVVEMRNDVITSMNSQIQELSKALTNIQSAVAGIQSTITGIQSSNAVIQSSNAGIQSSNAVIQSSNAVIQSSNAGIQSSIAGMQSSIAGIQSSIVGIQSTLRVTQDCKDVFSNGYNVSGVYIVTLRDNTNIEVYCDMATDGGGWLVIQRRVDGSENFERNWIDYVTGFGKLTGEFWLGNDNLYLLTSSKRYKLRIDLADFNRQTRYAGYTTFKVMSASYKYRLTVGGYTGTAGDSMNAHNGMYYSTQDQDNDIAGVNCAQQFHGAWWYAACHASNLNGRYLRGDHTTYADGVEWFAWRGHNYSLKISEMKIKPVAL